LKKKEVEAPFAAEDKQLQTYMKKISSAILRTIPKKLLHWPEQIEDLISEALLSLSVRHINEFQYSDPELYFAGRAAALTWLRSKERTEIQFSRLSKVNAEGEKQIFDPPQTELYESAHSVRSAVRQALDVLGPADRAFIVKYELNKHKRGVHDRRDQRRAATIREKVRKGA
jgi:hypothetical protein